MKPSGIRFALRPQAGKGWVGRNERPATRCLISGAESGKKPYDGCHVAVVWMRGALVTKGLPLHVFVDCLEVNKRPIVVRQCHIPSGHEALRPSKVRVFG